MSIITSNKCGFCQIYPLVPFISTSINGICNSLITVDCMLHICQLGMSATMYICIIAMAIDRQSIQHIKIDQSTSLYLIKIYVSKLNLYHFRNKS